jgi:hypothetical protein
MFVDPTSPRGVLGDLVWAHQNAPYYGYATQMRSILAYANNMTMTTYKPTANNLPINDPVTKVVFIHFVSVTGPTMSLFERQAFDAPRVFSGLSPDRVASIWTYTFPALSFNHPALMQAILALGSLQIATMQRMPPTAAMKHYHLAIRRVGRTVRKNDLRTRPATLAATLLLAYFEVWSSDHSKWCNHLFGARILLREIDLRAMTRNVLPLKRARRHELAQQQRRQQQQHPFTSNLHKPAGFYTVPSNGEAWDAADQLIDISIVNELAGSHLSPEDWDPGDCTDDVQSPGKSPTQVEHYIGEYEQFRDLFWWYAKMDIYQSILGCTKLL